jgi:methionyl aminopeptidase
MKQVSKPLKPKILIHKQEDFAGMRKAGLLAAQVLDFIGEFVQPGVTTEELNERCHEMIIKNGAIPAPLNYKGFPKSICTSVNHVVCHGIPGEKRLQNGDILNIDVTVIVEGWYGDSSRMYWVGNNTSIKAKKLTQVTFDALMMAIEKVKPGAHLSIIGKTIEQYVTKQGFSVVKDFCGHGIGRTFHAEPNVLHYYHPHGPDVTLEEGMFFTIEPMVNAGGYATKVMPDGWTAITKDRSLSAQFEHTVGVTKDGVEIFTLSPADKYFPK